MRLRFFTRSNKRDPSSRRRSAGLLMAVLVFSATLAGQEKKESQEDAVKRLMVEGMQLLVEGSPASLTKAIEKLEAAKGIMQSLKITLGEATMLSLIGHAYTQLDQNQKAIEKYEESLPLFRKVNMPQGEGNSHLRLGMIYSSSGEMEKAIAHFEHAVQLFRQAKDPNSEALALGTLATTHVYLGKPEEALKYFNQAIALFRAAKSPQGEATMLAGLAPLYNAAGQPEKARETLERALSISRAAKYRLGEAIALSGLGLLTSFLREIPKSIEYNEQALPLFRAENDRIGESLALHALCIAYVSSRDYKKGFDYCEQSQIILRAIGDRRTEALTLKHIAIGERNRGNLAAAQSAIESAITNIESLRTKVINPDFRVSYFEDSQDSYDFYIDLLMRQHRQRPNDGYDGKALQASELARARSLLDTLKEAKADIREGLDPELLRREREIQRRLNGKAQTQMQFLSPGQPEAAAKAIAAEIDSLIKELQQVETEIRQNSPHYAALTQPQPLTLKEIQTQVVDADTVLLEYSLGDERSYLWAVTSSSITSYELPNREVIETAAGDFYNLLNARNQDLKGETEAHRARRIAQSELKIPAAAAALSRMILAPAAAQFGKKRLAIVADGGLHFVPFSALPVPERRAIPKIRAKPLIADHEIVNLPSASTLGVIRTEAAGRQTPPKTIAVLADPVFRKDDERVTQALNLERAQASPSPTVKNAARREDLIDRQLIKAAQDTGVAGEGLYIGRLRGTRREAEQIVAMVPEIERRLALDFSASRQTAMSSELGQYRYVHFSTHGLVNSIHPELSGLLFSLVNERGESQDGFLRAHEIYNLKLPAEVVVLSACQTGIGKNIRGEGLVSLTRAFMYAGAPRLVVSLWDVSDQGTSELMVRFYRGMLQEHLRPAAALRAAQLSLMKEKRWSSPYFWASFALEGEWR